MPDSNFQMGWFLSRKHCYDCYDKSNNKSFTCMRGHELRVVCSQGQQVVCSAGQNFFPGCFRLWYHQLSLTRLEDLLLLLFQGNWTSFAWVLDDILSARKYPIGLFQWVRAPTGKSLLLLPMYLVFQSVWDHS